MIPLELKSTRILLLVLLLLLIIFELINKLELSARQSRSYFSVVVVVIVFVFLVEMLRIYRLIIIESLLVLLSNYEPTAFEMSSLSLSLCSVSIFHSFN
jgi:uncharacterized membrane protein